MLCVFVDVHGVVTLLTDKEEPAGDPVSVPWLVSSQAS